MASIKVENIQAVIEKPIESVSEHVFSTKVKNERVIEVEFEMNQSVNKLTVTAKENLEKISNIQVREIVEKPAKLPEPKAVVSHYIEIESAGRGGSGES